MQSAFGPVVVVPLSSAQHVFRLGAHVTQVSIALDPAATCPGGIGAATSHRCTYADFRQDLRLTATEEYTVRDNRAFVSARNDPFADIQPVMIFFSLLSLLIGLFMIYNNLTMTVLERRRDIGLLRAAGATSDWIRSLFLVQALIVGVAGGILGVVVGFVLALGLVEYLKAASGHPVPAPVPNPLALLAVFLIGVGATLVCGVFPARRAAAMPPLEALRAQSLYSLERSRRRVTLLGVVMAAAAILVLFLAITARPPRAGVGQVQLSLAGLGLLLLFGGAIALIPDTLRPLTAVVAWPLSRWIPGETALARNALLRRPNRTALTVAGLLVSSALVVAVAGLTQGALGAGERWVDSLFVSDRLVVSPVHQSDDIRREIEKVAGVVSASPIDFFSLRSQDRAVNMAAVDPLVYAQANRLEFVSGTPRIAYNQLQGTRAVFIPQRLADSRGLHAGDTMTLAAGKLTQDYRVVAIVTHSLPSPGGDEATLISLSNAKQDFGAEGFNILQVITPSPAAAGVKPALKEAAARYGMQLESVADVRAGVRKGIDSLLFLLTGVGFVGILLGLMSVITTMLLNIRESSREVGLLRAVGVTREQARRIILTQSSLLGLCGAITGSLLGIALVAVMVAVGSSSGFAPSYIVPWGVILAVIAVTLLGSLLAVAVPARRAAAVSVVAALRYE
jgi:putative ABC transport system permease protein